jgi:amino acid adenylation domain-containing protein/non-ribosomal peptide synthase protein (TIGR01720 family)
MAETEIARRLAELPAEQRTRLFEELRRRRPQERPAQPPLVHQSRADYSHQLSFAQQRLWFLNLYEPESPEYDIPQAFLIAGALDPQVLARALDGVVARHETLRTTFVSQEGEPFQVIAPSLAVELPFSDLGDRPAEEAWRQAMAQARADAARPFDLATGPLLRGMLFRLGEESYLLYVNVHHICYDGWSQGIFAHELAELYAAVAEGRQPALPELPIQYVDFALWQREWLAGDVLERQLAFWRRQLAGVAPLELPTDRPRPPIRTFAGGTLPCPFPAEVSARLHELVADEAATPFIVLAAALKALLCHYTAQQEVTLGTLIANRQRPEIEGLIGFFANTLVLRTELAGDPTFAELVRREREVAFEAYAHQDLPFEKLVDELNPPRDLARTPLFQAMLILLNAPGEPLALPGATLRPVPIDSRTSKFEMTLYVTEGEGGLDGYLEYNSDLFDAATLERFLDRFRALLGAFTADPGLRLSQAPLLSEAERRQLLVDRNETAAEVPALTLDRWIIEQAERTPGEIAVEAGGETLTYAQLAARGYRLARHLARLGVGPEVRVAIALERSADLVVALLGVLAAGGAYVPLDPEYPAERLALMLADSRPEVLLTQESLLPSLPATAARVLSLDRDRAFLEAESAAPYDGGADPANLAYVIFTSGSTGRPKGVQIPHSALVNFLASMLRQPGLAAGDRLLAVTTLSFDIAGLEIYLPLVAGGRLLLLSREETRAGERLLERLADSGATVMQATPATWRLLLGAGWAGDRRLKALCGGEALPRELADQLIDAVGELWNVYGPTEATIWATLAPLAEKGGMVPLGEPLANTRLYLLSRLLRPVPLGVPGELHLAGAGLSRGYLGRPAASAERFIPDPFATAPGGRLYQTGDLARRRLDGGLEFLGRIDNQVKVRGFRIELGEIEAALAAHPGVAQAVVLAREDTPGNRRLVGYLVTAPGAAAPETAELRSHLGERLPEYMVPALFVTLDELPLTPNGKVDRRALPAPDPAAAQREYVAPRNAREEKMAEIWGQILNLERVGIHDDFFELGGDSLLVVRVVTKAAKAGITVTTKQAFQHRTIADLVAAAGTTEIIAEQGPVTGHHPYTPAQLHFQELDHPNPGFHSTGTLLEVRQGAIDVAAVGKAMAVMERHHDTLRMRMIDDADGQRLWLDPPGGEPALLHLDLSALPDELHVKTMSQAVRTLVTSFRLTERPLFKGLVVSFEEGRPQYLFLTTHFYPVDLGSWVPLLDDFDTAYRQLAAGEKVALQPKTTSAPDWAARLHERARPGGMPEEERSYWLEQVPVEPVRFALDHETGPNDWPHARIERIELDQEETEILLSHAPRAFGVQIDGILVTAILSAFEVWTGERSLPILLLGHGREPLHDDMDITRTVGWFNTIYPNNVRLGPDPDLAATARFVNQQLRAVPHGGIGYGLMRYLSGDEETSRRLAAAPKPQVFFNYIGPDNSKELQAFRKIENYGGYFLDLYTKRLCPITIGGYIIEDALLMKWEWSVSLHRQESIRRLTARCEEVLRWFVDEYRRRRAASGAGR